MDLAKSVERWSQCIHRVVKVIFSGDLNLHLLCGHQPLDSCVWGVPCSLWQHHLTLSLSWPWPFIPLQIVYKKWYFLLNLFSISHQHMQSSWLELSFLSSFFLYVLLLFTLYYHSIPCHLGPLFLHVLERLEWNKNLNAMHVMTPYELMIRKAQCYTKLHRLLTLFLVSLYK